MLSYSLLMHLYDPSDRTCCFCANLFKSFSALKYGFRGLCACYKVMNDNPSNPDGQMILSFRSTAFARLSSGLIVLDAADPLDRGVELEDCAPVRQDSMLSTGVSDRVDEIDRIASHEVEPSACERLSPKVVWDILCLLAT